MERSNRAETLLFSFLYSRLVLLSLDLESATMFYSNRLQACTEPHAKA